jgi:hypothetical protein
MYKRRLRFVAALFLFVSPALCDDPPDVQFQPVPCALPDRPVTLCGGISDDVQVAKASIFFRKARDKYFSYVEMTFGGLNYCGTLPAPKEGKIRSIEYYVQAVDTAYQITRSSTYQLAIQGEGVCQFPPAPTDPAKASSITVYATHRKQGKKLPKDFIDTGVTFVPVAR